MATEAVTAPVPPGAQYSVEFQAVCKIYRHRPVLFNWVGRERGGETRALDDVSLVAAPGEVLVLLGANGSGKTTLLKLVSSTLLPDAGRVLVQGADTRSHPGLTRRAVGFAVASERSFYPRLTARENLDLFAALDDVPRGQRAARVDFALEMSGLSDAGDMLAMKFSSGMFQRLGIARALLKQPSLLLLDEPTRSLDPVAAARVWQLVRDAAQRNSTVILATHQLDEAVAVGRSVAILRRGRLVAARKITSPTSSEELRKLYFQALNADSPPTSGNTP